MRQVIKPFSFDVDNAESTIFLQDDQQSNDQQNSDQQSSGHSSTGVLDSPIETQEPVKTRSHIFTFTNISESLWKSLCCLLNIPKDFSLELPKLLELPVLFTGQPSKCNAGSIICSEDGGGFGDIHVVQLHEPVEVELLLVFHLIRCHSRCSQVSCNYLGSSRAISNCTS